MAITGNGTTQTLRVDASKETDGPEPRGHEDPMRSRRSLMMSLRRRICPGRLYVMPSSVDMSPRPRASSRRRTGPLLQRDRFPRRSGSVA